MKTKAKKAYEPYFSHASHLYHTPDGMRLEGVTDILQGELGGFDGFSASAAQRGTHVHTAIQFHTEGGVDEKTLTSEEAEYLDCFKRAAEHHNIKIVQNELMRYHPKYLYAGRMDAIVEVNGVLGVIDYKTGAPDEHRDRWQLAAYLGMIAAEIPGITGRWNLYLKPGKYGGTGFKLVERNGQRDFLEFLALFSAYQIKKNLGYIKERRDLHE